MNLHSFLILAVGVALALGLRFLLKSRLWGLALFMAIVGTGAALLYWPGAYTPKDRLPLGIDLAGGTTLIYDVQVPAGKTASEVVDTTIATLSKRVDPSGTRNLVWKRLGDKRTFPSLAQIVVAGHSAGGQVVTRYSMANKLDPVPGVGLSYVVANPSSYAWPVAERPLPTGTADPTNADKEMLVGCESGLAAASLQ